MGADDAPPGGTGNGVGGAVLASAADQGVAALTNIAVVIVAARQATAADFADFAIAYTIFALLLGAFTAYVGQALVLRRGGPAALGRDCRASVTFTLLASLPLGAALALTTPLAPEYGALGAVLPVLLTQDAMRYAFAVLGRPRLALAVDVLRLALAVGVLAVQPAGAGPERLVLAWGLSALPALVFGAVLLAAVTRGAGRPTAERLRALLERRHLGRRFVVEFGVGNAASQLAIVGLGLIANPLAVGALRGATTLFGPLNVLFNAATGFGPPLLNRLTGLGSPGRKARSAGLAGAALAGIAGCWALALALLPDAAGRQLLGDTWDAAAELLPATGSQYAAMALGTCGLLALRVLTPRATLGVQLVFSLLSVACLLVGYALGGVVGAAWGLVAGSAAKAVASWVRVAFEVRVSFTLRDRRAAGREAGAS
ncbi:hypothetical protein ACTWP5_06970 [Streptomyces sp. 4N509B]|uniref:hypothetical protein n=1 Tax=Streptomyces sp. 4N509B TaxID=3457413 RepID=UPI003FD4952D